MSSDLTDRRVDPTFAYWWNRKLFPFLASIRVMGLMFVLFGS